MAPKISRYILDKVTAELFDAGNYRQALRNTEKKLKKTPTSIHSLTLKALLLCELEQYEESRAICSRLVTQKPSVSASDELAFLFLTLCHLGRQGHGLRPQEIESLWKNAIAQRQSKADQQALGKQWADLSIREANWTSFAKAAVQLQKLADPKSQDFRKYVFWEAVGSYNASLHMENPRERIVAEKLTLRKLELNANTGPETPDSMVALADWVNTSEEQIFTQQLIVSHADNFPNKIKFLSPAMYFTSEKLVSGASLERIQLCEDVLFKAGRFDESYRLSFDVLHNTQQSRVDYLSDDWHNLRILCDSAMELGDPERIQGLITQLKTKFAAGPLSSRGIREAHLSLTSNFNFDFPSKSTDEKIEESTSFRAFKEHFKDYATFAWGIESISKQFFALEKNERTNARKYMNEYTEGLKPGPEDSEGAQLKWITAECKILHLDLEVIKRGIISEPSGLEDAAHTSILIDYVVNCIHLYKISRCHTAQLAKTETSPGNRACLLAVDALLALSTRTDNQFYSVQAAFLLECAIRDSGDRDLKIKHISILKSLGISSRALEVYKQLGIKQVICDSMCPVYFARAGTVLPSADPKKDLSHVLEKGLSFYKTSLSKISKLQQLALSDLNYQSIVNMETFKQSLIDSLTRRTLILEGRRIGRLTGRVSEETIKDDYRVAADVKCIESFNCKIPYSEGVFSSGGPLITNDYVRWLTVLDDVHDSIRSKELRDSNFDSLNGLDSSIVLTSAEQSSCKFASVAISILLRISQKSVDYETVTLPELLDEMNAWIENALKEFEEGMSRGANPRSRVFLEFEYLHRASLLTEAFQSAWFLGDKVISTSKTQPAFKKEDPKKIATIAKQIQQQAAQGFNNIKADVAKRKETLDNIASDTNSVVELANLTGDNANCKTGSAILNLVGERWIKLDFGRFIQSASLALDAVIAFKAPGT